MAGSLRMPDDDPVHANGPVVTVGPVQVDEIRLSEAAEVVRCLETTPPVGTADQARLVIKPKSKSQPARGNERAAPECPSRPICLEVLRREERGRLRVRVAR